MNRRGFLKGILGVGAALGAAGLAKIEIPKILPEEPILLPNEDFGPWVSEPEQDVHVDKQLTDISVSYMQESQFLSPKVFPTFSVKEHELIYYRKREICATKMTCVHCGRSLTVTDRELHEYETYYAGSFKSARRELYEMKVGPCNPSRLHSFKMLKMQEKMEREYADAFFGGPVQMSTSISYYDSKRQPLSTIMSCSTSYA